MPQVHARFFLSEVTSIPCHWRKDTESDWERVEGIRVILAPSGKDPFGTATPGGSLEMVIANPEAIGFF